MGQINSQQLSEDVNSREEMDVFEQIDQMEKQIRAEERAMVDEKWKNSGERTEEEEEMMGILV